MASSCKCLVIDLCAGVSGLCVTMLSLHFQFLFTRWPLRRIPSLHNVPLQSCLELCTWKRLLMCLRVSLILPFLARQKIRGSTVGGGSPCQGNSFLNKRRQDLADDRSMQPALRAS